jgi:hypothetical protein
VCVGAAEAKGTHMDNALGVVVVVQLAVEYCIESWDFGWLLILAVEILETTTVELGIHVFFLLMKNINGQPDLSAFNQTTHEDIMGM